MKTVLLTGGSGFLGSRIRFYYEQLEKTGWQIVAPAHREMDVTKPEQIKGCMDRFHPELIVHCGMVADTKYVLEHPVQSFKTTVEGSCHLAEAAAKKNIPLLFMSSDYVYQGRTIAGNCYDAARDGLAEEEAGTENEYGRQKLEAEKRCLEIHPKTIALRLSWMYDLPKAGLKTKQNLLTDLINAAKERKPIAFALHEYRGITNVWEVIKNLERAAALPGGSYNFGSRNNLSTVRVARIAAEILGLPEELIGEDRECFAKSPRNLTMSLHKINQYGIVFPDTAEGLQSFLPSL